MIPLTQSVLHPTSYRTQVGQVTWEKYDALPFLWNASSDGEVSGEECPSIIHLKRDCWPPRSFMPPGPPTTEPPRSRPGRFTPEPKPVHRQRQKQHTMIQTLIKTFDCCKLTFSAQKEEPSRLQKIKMNQHNKENWLTGFLWFRKYFKTIKSLYNNSIVSLFWMKAVLEWLLTGVWPNCFLMQVSHRSGQAWVGQGISPGHFGTPSANPTVVGGGESGAAA